MTITLGSLFDGIGVFPLAASRHGITPIWASEIVPDAISITKRHFPAMVHLGDITKLDGGKIPAVQLCYYLWLALSKFVIRRVALRRVYHGGNRRSIAKINLTVRRNSGKEMNLTVRRKTILFLQFYIHSTQGVEQCHLFLFLKD